MAVTLITIASFAAEHRPSVTVRTLGNFEVVIDGRTYAGNGIMAVDLSRGNQHLVQVYERKAGGFFGARRKKLVTSTTFLSSRNDISITVDFRGQVHVDESRLGQDQWGSHADNYKRDHDRPIERKHSF